MRRIGVIGALVLILAMVGGPAFAQVDPSGGSVLPPDQARSQPLPPVSSGSSSVAQATASPALADTGIPVATGLVIGAGLVVAGGGALVLTRRRATA